MKLLYIANMRLPTEKAHGVQIVQNCEALAAAGAEVTLWAARRVNRLKLHGQQDLWFFYGVARDFEIGRVPSLDLIWLVPAFARRFAFWLQWLSFALLAVLRARFTAAEVVYSRDRMVLLLCGRRRGQQRAYEVHHIAERGIGRWLQGIVARRMDVLFPVTQGLAAELLALGASAERICVVPDGIRAANYEELPGQMAARRELGWPEDAYIVTYVGQLQTMGMAKGVEILVEALAPMHGASLAIIGGPAAAVAEYQRHWRERGGDEARFLAPGQVPAACVSLYLAASNVGVLPFPRARHYAQFASPLKLFEYMAAGCAIVASDLPSLREILREGETALFAPPGDIVAWQAALQRLREDVALRKRLGEAARAEALREYSWAARAAKILHFLRPRRDGTRFLRPRRDGGRP